MLNKLTNNAIIEKRPCRRKAEGPLFEVSIKKYSYYGYIIKNGILVLSLLVSLID